MAMMQQPAGGAYPVVDFNNRRSPKPAGTYFNLYDDLREISPFIRSSADQGWWILTRQDAIREALQRPDIFSNTSVVVNEPEPVYRLIPDMLDPPEQTAFRRVLGPVFSPRAVKAREPAIVARCVELIESFVDDGRCDFIEDFARKFPTTIFMEILGLPVTESAKFMAWEDLIIRASTSAPDYAENRANGVAEVTAYFADLIATRRRDSRDDLVSYLVNADIDGAPIPDEDLISTCLLLFMAGLDTVAMQLAWSFLHLATHPGDRIRLVNEPVLIPVATEEFLRAFAFVAPGRKLTRDIEFDGCPFKAGDMVLLPLSCATRDPRAVDQPYDIVIDREVNPHIAFGAGPHRCLGSNLARRELHIAVEEWHKRIPEYRVMENTELLEHGGMVGLDLLPLTWK
jgi:cytochrome P450